MKRLAAIDLGTNSALLLVAEISGQMAIRPIFECEKIIRLGEGIDANRILKNEAILRAVNTIKEYKIITQKYGIENIILSGTSAVRDARNRDEFLTQIKSETNIHMQVLSGAEEARLTYLGALSNKNYLTGENLMLDIGGGSTEFIWGRQNKISHAISLDIGSVRLRERLQHHDPVTDDEFESIQKTIEETLRSKLNHYQNTKPENFVAIAGTVTTLAAMHLKLPKYEPDKVDNKRLSLQEIRRLIDIFKTRPAGEITKMPGINPARASVILPGAMILLSAMIFFNFDEVIVSDRGLRYGLLIDNRQSLIDN